MRNRFFFLYLFIIYTLCGQAQSIISGWISNKTDKKPIANVAVILYDDEGETIAYAITNPDGGFSINTESELTHFTLHARLLGYEEMKKRLENKTQLLFIEMSFGEIELNEVVVKSRPIWNREDTLVYSVDVFRSVADKTIGDLLKKLPGVEVNESGGIKYQGEPINRFYIEGLDLLERRYGIATNNVPVDMIQNVEIIENHQPVQALKEAVSSDKAAVNLRLKKDKSARPVGNIALGGGYSDEMLWLAEALAMKIHSKQQSIVIYKTNNAAKDISTELTEQTLSITEMQDALAFSPKTLLNAISFSYPPLEKKRYIFNNSHVVSANNLWKTGETSQLRVNIQYLHDLLQENSSRKSEYFLADGSLTINETNSLSTRANLIDAAVTYTENNSRYYLNNAFSWNSSRNISSSAISLDVMEVYQRFNVPVQLVKNNLQYVKKRGKHIWDISSFVAYSSQPQQLLVLVDTIASEQMQSVKLSQFYTRNSTYYSLGWNNSSFTLKGAFEATLNRFDSQLTHPVFTDSARSEISWDQVIFELIPTYKYQKGRLTLNADVTLQKQFLRINDAFNNKPVDGITNFFFVLPSFRLNYRFGPMLTFRARYAYTQSIGDFFDVTDAYFMSAYRSFNKRSKILPNNKRHSFTTGFQYRNPLTTFFFNSLAGYLPSSRNVVTSQRFIGNEMVIGSEGITTRYDIFLWSAYIGKYFSGIRTNASFSASYNSLKGERLQQGVLFPVQASDWMFMPKLTTKISDAASVTYQAMAANRITEIKRDNHPFRSSMWQVTQQLSAFYQLGKKWEFNGRLEHSFNEIGENNSVKMFFADVAVGYKHGQMEYNLSANNLFNQHNYSYSIYNGLDRFYYAYHLRSRMLLLSVSYRY